MPIESFQNPDRGLDREARVDRLVEALLSDEHKPQSTADWPRIQTAIRRGGLFVLEASTAAFSAMLRFDPDKVDAGDYEIRHLPRGRVEKGRTVKITQLKAEETDSRVSMLKPFTDRFAIVTVGSERPHARMMWLVGLNSFKSVDESIDDD
jgi:hypothetical protein